MIEPGIRRIQHPESILAWLNLQKRHHLAVHAVHVPEELLNPNKVLGGTVNHLRVVERTVAMKETILQHERNLELTLGQIQSFLYLISNEIETGEARVNIQPCDSQAVIVVPERCCRLAVRVGRRSRIELRAMFALGCEPCLRITIVVG